MEEQKGISLLQSIFSKPLPNRTALIGNRIVNDEPINELVEHLTSGGAREEIEVIINELIRNFTSLRMNVVRFIKASSSQNLFLVLFNLYLSYEGSPCNSILLLLEILLREGTLENNSFSWLFEGIRTKIKLNAVSYEYLRNYLTLLRYFYENNSNQKEDEEDTPLPQSYFYFYPNRNPSHEVFNLIFRQINPNEPEFSNGVAISIWFKFPFREGNIPLLLEEEIANVFTVIELAFDNDEKIKCCIELEEKSLESCLIKTHYRDKLVNQVYPLTDQLAHLFLIISFKDNSCRLIINDEVNCGFNDSSIGMNKVKSVFLFKKEWFGEVSSVVMYSYPCSTDSEPVVFQEEKIKTFNQYSNAFNNPDALIPNATLVYLPETKGENSWNDFDNNSRNAFLFSDSNSGYYNYCNWKETINRNFGIDCLLPIFEFIYTQRSIPPFSVHLSELVNSFLDLLPLNLMSQFYLGSMDSFHRILSLFLEKMPAEIFTDQLYNFLFHPFFFTQEKNNEKLSGYLQSFVLNDRLMRKFNYSYDFWKKVTTLQGGAFPDILSYISIQQMIRWILWLDKDRYTEYCCIDHRDAFTPKPKCSMKVMSPPFNDRFTSLSKLITNKIKAEKVVLSSSISSKEQLKDSESSLLQLSKLLYLNNSPCLTVRVLQIMKHFISSFDQAIFNNCCAALSSPFLDVKNACIELIILCIEICEPVLLNTFREINIGELITEYSDKKDLSLIFTKEYIRTSTLSTYTLIQRWLLPFDNDRHNSNNGKQSEKGDSEVIEQPQFLPPMINNNDTFDLTKSDLDNVKQLILFIITKLKEDNSICQPFFKEAFDMVISKLDKLTEEEISKLNAMKKKGLLERKFFSLKRKKKGLKSATVLYLKSLKMYYLQCINPVVVIKLIPKLSKIVTQLIQIDSFSSEKQPQSKVINERLIKKTLFILQKNDLLMPKVIESRYLLIDFISTAISYNFCLSINNTEGLFLDMLTSEDASWSKMFNQIIQHYAPFWESSDYSIDKKLKDIISHSNLNDKISTEVELFTRVKPELHFNLAIILSLIYVNMIKKSPNAKAIDLMAKYGQFLYFILIIAVYPQKETNRKRALTADQEQNVFYATLIIGFNCLAPIFADFRDAKKAVSKLLHSMLHFFDVKKYQKQKGKLIETVATAYKGTEKLLLTSFLTPFVESESSELFLKVFVDVKGKDTYTEDIFKSLVLKAEFNVIIDQCNRKMNEEHQNQFFSQIISTKVQHKATVVSHLKSAVVDEFVDQLMMDANSLEVKDMKKRKRYKQMKKVLFSWNRPWSERELFYSPSPELNLLPDLKVHNGFKAKFLNHYTKAFTRPFLVPIVNINDYLPEFDTFNTTRDLFNPNDTHQEDYVTTCLNVNFKAIEEESNGEQVKTRQNIDEFTNDNEKRERKNLLFEYNEKKDVFYKHQLASLSNDFSFKYNTKICERLNLIRSDKNDFDTCCIVKASRHIKGILVINSAKNIILFKPFLPRSIVMSKHEKSDITFDALKETCFGSYCKNYPKDHFRKHYSFQISRITHLIERKYYYRDSGLEIFFSNHKSYFFNFLSEQKRTDVFQLLKEHLKDKAVSLEFKSSKVVTFIANARDDWRRWNVSNFHFLMLLNMASNRSFFDISQYPVFPWIICDYTKEQLTMCDSEFRDLSLPVGMLEYESRPKSIERKNEYIDNYQSLVDEEGKDSLFNPYFFGSHYSNPIYVSHFLTRLFPLLEVAIEIQGNKFDNPNRLFCSVAAAFAGATTQKGDVRELIPEFYYLPEMLVNINNFNMSVRRNGEKVDNVDCPLWAKESPYEFIALMRRYLESAYVSEHINGWIDLIFGSKQRGPGAKEARNLFVSTTYSENMSIDEKMTQTERENQYRLVEFGLSPKQLFTTPLEARKNYQSMTKKYQNQKAEEFIIKTLNISNQSPIQMKAISSNEIHLYQSNGTIEAIKYNKSIKFYEKTDQGQYGFKLLSQASPKKTGMSTNKIHFYYERNNIPFLSYNKGNFIVQGGFFDGSLLFSNGSTVLKIHKVNLNKKVDRSPICVLTIVKEDYIVIGGSENGTISMYTHSKSQLLHYKSVQYHNDKVLDICTSKELNAIATASKDNYVHLIILPALKLVRSLYVEQCKRVFLSDSPLPSIIVYSSKNDAFFIYSLNGLLIQTIPFDKKEEGEMISPRLIKDPFYCDHLIYLTSKNSLYIKSLPHLEKVGKYHLGASSLRSYYDLDEENQNLIVYTENSQELRYYKDFFKVI